MEDSTNFIEQIREHFSFLQSEFGFRIDGTSEKGDVALIRYCSERVYVILFRGPPDFEPGLAFGRLGIDDTPEGYSFEQGDLIQLDSCREWKWRKSDCEPFGGLLPELARLLRDCGKRCLKGDECDFVEMKTRRDAAIKKWRSEERELSIRTRAEIAWREKNYETVSKLYSTIEIALTDVERKRLSVARRFMSNES